MLAYTIFIYCVPPAHKYNRTHPNKKNIEKQNKQKETTKKKVLLMDKIEKIGLVNYSLSLYFCMSKRDDNLDFPGLVGSTEAGTGGVLSEKVLLEILQNSQENTCARVSFLIKHLLSCEFCEISKNTFSYKTPPGDCFWKQSFIDVLKIVVLKFCLKSLEKYFGEILIL